MSPDRSWIVVVLPLTPAQEEVVVGAGDGRCVGDDERVADGACVAGVVIAAGELVREVGRALGVGVVLARLTLRC
jgi:hypothetical protein